MLKARGGANGSDFGVFRSFWWLFAAELVLVVWRCTYRCQLNPLRTEQSRTHRVRSLRHPSKRWRPVHDSQSFLRRVSIPGGLRPRFWRDHVPRFRLIPEGEPSWRDRLGRLTPGRALDLPKFLLWLSSKKGQKPHFCCSLDRLFVALDRSRWTHSKLRRWGSWSAISEHRASFCQFRGFYDQWSAFNLRNLSLPPHQSRNNSISRRPLKFEDFMILRGKKFWVGASKMHTMGTKCSISRLLRRQRSCR